MVAAWETVVAVVVAAAVAEAAVALAAVLLAAVAAVVAAVVAAAVTAVVVAVVVAVVAAMVPPATSAVTAVPRDSRWPARGRRGNCGPSPPARRDPSGRRAAGMRAAAHRRWRARDGPHWRPDLHRDLRRRARQSHGQSRCRGPRQRLDHHRREPERGEVPATALGKDWKPW